MKRYSVYIGMICFHQESEDTFQDAFETLQEAKDFLETSLSKLGDLRHTVWSRIWDEQENVEGGKVGKLRRFLLFTGYYYYPAGGMDDFREDFDTLEEAVAGLELFLKGEAAPDTYWAHIYDTETRKEVFSSC